MPPKNGKKEEKIPLDIVVCSNCKGNKILKNGKECYVCQGFGIFLRVGKSGIYYWGENIVGFYQITRRLFETAAGVIHFVIYSLTFITLVLGVIFVVQNNEGFLDSVTNDLSGIEDESYWIAEALIVTFYKIVRRVLDVPLVLIEEKGFGALMFWISSLGMMYNYYYIATRDTSRKEINLSLPEFRIFYNKKAKEFEYPVNIADYTSPSVKHILEATLDLAHNLKQAPSLYHLAKIVIQDKRISILLKRLEIDKKRFDRDLDNMIKNLPQDRYYRQDGILGGTILSQELERMIILAFKESLAARFEKVEVESLFLALFHGKSLEKYFRDKDVEITDVRNTILWTKSWSRIKVRLKRPRKIQHVVMNKAWTARQTPKLDRFSYDITDWARSGLTGYVADREKEVNSLMRILERTSKNNALLIGEEGSGREAIVKELANRMIKERVLPTLQDKRLVALDIGALVSGARAGGDLEMRIREVLEDMARGGNVILYISDIHNIAAAGEGEGFDASKILSPILSQKMFQVIGSTDYRNYHRYIEPRADFANNFDLIKVDELDEKNTLEVLAVQAKIIEAREGVIMTYGALRKAVELSKRYITDRILPGKAIDLLSETAVEVRRRGAGSVLRGKDIMEVITEKTGIPLVNITSSEAEKLLNLEEKLHERVIGQHEAVKAVAASIRRVRVGMKQKNRPIGTFLFLGPTGVGKTELAKALAEVYYGSEKAMIRLDMSEYQTVSSVEKLIGSSSDLSEMSSGGILTESIKRKPFSLVLLDELEKANKKVLNLFLQVFDDGRLTDNLGKTVDFTNTIIIATSNAGSEVVKDMVISKDSNNERMFKMLEPYLLKNFTPEFLNRFTAKIIFVSLSMKDVIAITKLQISKLTKKMDKAQRITISVTPEAVERLAKLGYSTEYGARFLQRVIQDKVENLVATKFLRGEIKRGGTFVIRAEDI